MKWLITIAVFLLFSCSVPKRIEWHQKQLMKLGQPYVLSDTIRIATIDSFPVIQHDSIVWQKLIVQRDTVIQTQYLPKTRWKTRIEYRERIKTIRVKADQEVRIVREKAKPKINWWIVLAAFVIGIMIIPTIKGLLRI
jgi:hypothetical protein